MKMDADAVLQSVWVRGEISNFTRHSSGHLYFTLKDKDSRIKCVMFAGQASRLPFAPQNGTRVIANGGVSVYERDGQYQMYVNGMQPDGIGSLYLAYEQLKQKLDAEGLFSPARKKPIPTFPSAVGVITSPTGAAVRDIVITLQRRNPAVSILLYPVSVQGTNAAPSIVKAIRAMNERRDVDVLIVGRGGGSLEELWAFNEESVARAIFASDVPVISAVGHETDVTIADYVADLRAATPTAAAELAVPSRLELRQELMHLKQRMTGAMNAAVSAKRESLVRLRRSPFLTNPKRQLMMQQTERLDRYTSELTYRTRTALRSSAERYARLDRRLSGVSPREAVRDASKGLDMAKLKLMQRMNAVMRERGHAFDMHVKRLDALSPLKVMSRGYSLVYNEKKRLVKSVNEVQLGDLVRVRLADGELNCQVWEMKGEQDGE
ncbi:exodeoxyribonuclease VII large subunit [Paenibacillus sp. TRM 82003]|nr:exodeoxyribonuclease VII large subunit [Paenibacillus sp. TRM 82003]